MVHRIEETVARGVCIGCGACSVATSGAIRVTLSTHRLYAASLEGATEQEVRRASSVCPFSDESKDEDELGAPHAENLSHDARVGFYSRVSVGAVASDADRERSSSGGMTTWLLERLLARGDVDAVIHVGRGEGTELFVSTISRAADAADERRKSQYYATTLSDVLQIARQSNERFALVGVPCFIKATRLLCDQDDVLASRLSFFIGLVCGHLKSQYFAEALAWQAGVHPDDLAAVDFRVKNASRSAAEYDFAAWSRSRSDPHIRATRELVGGNWGHGAFQPEACNFCDDIFAETADIVFGDAWLPRYSADWRGTNVIVSRNRELDQLLDDGAQDSSLVLENLSLDDAAQSQAGNFRHRRDGLAVRLADDIRSGLSVPRKRVAPDARRVGRRRRKLIRQRRDMSRLSFATFREARMRDDLQRFLQPFEAEIARYRRYEGPLWKRVARGLRSAVRRAVPSIPAARSRQTPDPARDPDSVG